MAHLKCCTCWMKKFKCFYIALPHVDCEPPYFKARVRLHFLPFIVFQSLQTFIVCSAIFDIITSDILCESIYIRYHNEIILLFFNTRIAVFRILHISKRFCQIFAKNRLKYWWNEAVDLKFNYSVWVEIGRNFYHRRNFCPKNFGYDRDPSRAIWNYIQNFHILQTFFGIDRWLVIIN